MGGEKHGVYNVEQQAATIERPTNGNVNSDIVIIGATATEAECRSVQTLPISLPLSSFSKLYMATAEVVSPHLELLIEGSEFAL